MIAADDTRHALPVRAILVQVMAGGDERRDMVPHDETAIRAAAAAVRLPIPTACMPGVVANLDLLERHAAILRHAREAGQ